MKKINEYLSTAQAAKILGVSKNTLFYWEKTKKLIPIRTPVNNHRLYIKEDLEKILEQSANSRNPKEESNGN